MSEQQFSYENLEGDFNPASAVRKTRAWSVAALVLSIISILCCCVYWLGLFAGVFAVVCAIVSRRVLGYFDGLSVAAIIVSIFGIVFSALMTYVVLVLMRDPEIIEILKTELEGAGIDYSGLALRLFI
ncbi:MAG: hypothetical protein J6Q85_05330 [Clostridia bacterium]|nr:hypothetical protein [Clostridia bacterium]